MTDERVYGCELCERIFGTWTHDDLIKAFDPEMKGVNEDVWLEGYLGRLFDPRHLMPENEAVGFVLTVSHDSVSDIRTVTVEAM